VTEACRGCPVRLVEDAGRLLGASINELVPAEAQTHLANAQRELLLALAVTLEHNARRAAPPARKRSRAGKRPSRVDLE
jgi:hypothetical protein